jgi:hypothetical protein
LFEGNNELSKAEILLAETYADLGRPDLARCVEGGKVYQRLAWILDWAGPWSEYPQLLALGRAMGLEMPESMGSFVELQMETYKEGLKGLTNSDGP